MIATKSTIVQQSADGRIFIPEEFLRAIGVQFGDPLRMTLVDGAIKVEPAGAVPDRGPNLYAKLYEAFAPVRDGILAAGYTEEEINADIDAAIAAARAARD